MEHKRPIAIGTTLLGLLAIAATAGIYGNRSSAGFGGGKLSTSPTGPGQSATGLPPWLVENLITWILIAGVLILVVSAVAVVWLRGVEGLRDIARFVANNAVSAAAVFLLFVGARFALTLLSVNGVQLPGAAQQNPSQGAPGTDPGGAAGAGAGSNSIPTVFITLAVLALAGVFVFYLFHQRGAGDSIVASAGGGADATASDAAAEGDGQQAVVIEDVPQSNAVYRAWREMATEAVDATDRTATASDVARAAVQSGFDRDAVATLTDLFEEVRYGGRAPTDERERRAEAALDALDGDGRAGS